jgi:hypothetical protein
VSEHAASDPPRAQELLAESLRAALTLGEIKAIAEEVGIPADDVRQTSDRHWTLATRLSGN